MEDPQPVVLTAFTLLNASLAKLLERYAKTQPLVIHHELRNFAVEHWKNPWLPINQNRWALVSESIRKMVRKLAQARPDEELL